MGNGDKKEKIIMNFNVDSGIAFAIILALVAMGVGWGVLKERTNNQSKDISKIEASYKAIDTKLDSICDKVSAIEVKVGK